MVSGNYFSVLGLKPAAGRLLSSSDDTAENVVTTGVLLGIPLSLASSPTTGLPVWTQGNGSIFVDPSHFAAGHGGGASRICSGATRGEGRSHSGATVRMIAHTA